MSLFVDKPILFETMHFRDGDYTSALFFKTIVNNLSYIEEYLSSYDYSIHTIEDVFDYIEENLYLNVLSSFDEYQKYYLKHKASFKNLFINLKNTEPFDDQVYTKFLLKNNNTIDAKFLSEQAQFICERAYEEIIKMGLDSEKKQI